MKTMPSILAPIECVCVYVCVPCNVAKLSNFDRTIVEFLLKLKKTFDSYCNLWRFESQSENINENTIAKGNEN